MYEAFIIYELTAGSYSIEFHLMYEMYTTILTIKFIQTSKWFKRRKPYLVNVDSIPKNIDFYDLRETLNSYNRYFKENLMPIISGEIPIDKVLKKSE
jgi:hypothetical protein